MHFEFLVEDYSGKLFLEIVVPKLLHTEHSFRIHSYKGIGHIPRNLGMTGDAQKRILLQQLPRLLQGYGKAYKDVDAAIIVVCDLDDKDETSFLGELEAVLEACSPKPKAIFCLAIEEGEAWLLGDMAAVRTGYPKAKQAVLSSYINDSICGTWEKLAEAVYPGGATALKKSGWQTVGAEKAKWATNVAPHMNLDLNLSESFCHFRDTMREIGG